MDHITKLIKSEIKRQYKSVRRFSERSGIPYSTLSNALAKGVGGTSYDTVVKICRLLSLKHMYDPVFHDRFYEMGMMLAALDEHAVHAVHRMVKVEYDRCQRETADMCQEPLVVG